MEFEDRLKALIFCHLEEHASGRHLIQVLKEDGFAREHIAPEDGIEKSNFFEAVSQQPGAGTTPVRLQRPLR